MTAGDIDDDGVLDDGDLDGGEGVSGEELPLSLWVLLPPRKSLCIIFPGSLLFSFFLFFFGYALTERLVITTFTE